jgi:hypothetical protein
MLKICAFGSVGLYYLIFLNGVIPVQKGTRPFSSRLVSYLFFFFESRLLEQLSHLPCFESAKPSEMKENSNPAQGPQNWDTKGRISRWNEA